LVVLYRQRRKEKEKNKRRRASYEAPRKEGKIKGGGLKGERG